MIWILATRGAATKLRASPFTETAIEGVHSVVYRPGIEPVPFSGDEPAAVGVYGRGARLSKCCFRITAQWPRGCWESVREST
jgi:hypothetical protein